MFQNEEHLKKQYLAALEQKLALKQGLPHLYGNKFYRWQRRFWNSANKYNFITAANQIGKSSINIRKAIHWATEKAVWPKLWKKEPTQFWYFYPDANLSTAEFHEKWVKEYLPSGPYKDDEKYGWKAEFDNRKKIHALHFKSGVTIYFKTYEQKVSSLQAATVFAVFVDEEMPPDIFPEINMRMIANDGYWHMVFTATLGSEFWRQTMEMKGAPEERFKDALKLQVSMYDCLKYEDGTPSHWTAQRIEEIKASCSSEQEVLRRVYGRFIKDSGRTYPHFSRSINVTTDDSVPKDWYYVSGVDPGSGGSNNHPAAMVVLAVSPDHRKAKVIRVKRLNGIETTAYDTLQFYKELVSTYPMRLQKYDWACKDFGILAEREGIAFLPAHKERTFGIGLVNSLFRHGVVEIVQSPDSELLITELENLNMEVDKSHAKDDLCDALRYALVGPPWDFTDAPDSTKLVTVGQGRTRRTEKVPNDGVDLFIQDLEDCQYEWDNLGY